MKETNMQGYANQISQYRTGVWFGEENSTPYFKNAPEDSEFWTPEQMRELIQWGVQTLDASDIRFVTGTHPFVKANGRWRPACNRITTRLDIESFVPVLMRNEIALSDIQSGYPADFRFDLTLDRGVYLRFRGNITAITQTGGNVGLDIVFRTIPTDVPYVKDMDVSLEMLRHLFPDRGLVLISGPMGSGKTTLLASIIREIREKHAYKALAAYENPQEFDYSQIASWGVLAQSELPFNVQNFQDIARNMARRSVEIVLVGESRDQDTFQALLGASNMGIALYTTLHANSVADTFSRIVNEFPTERQNTVLGTLVSSSRFFMHQRLLMGAKGRRVPIREYMGFDEGMRLELANMNNLSRVLVKTHEYVKQYGHSLLSDAEILLAGKRIDLETYKKIEMEYKDVERALRDSGKKVDQWTGVDLENEMEIDKKTLIEHRNTIGGPVCR